MSNRNLSPTQFFHASTSPTWEPREGFVHAGTEAAARERAHNETLSGRETRQYLHVFEPAGELHHEVVPDTYANFASGNKDEPRHHVYESLAMDQRYFNTPPGNRVLGEIGKALRQGKVVPYKNHTEDEGSVSVVARADALRHVATRRL